MNKDSQVEYYCPKCFIALDQVEAKLQCPACSTSFSTSNDYYCFDKSKRINEMDYGQDNNVLETENTELKARLHRYILPQILGGVAKGKKILSVGCGGGGDVEELNKLGAEAYGMDFAYRTKAWRLNGCDRAKFFVSTAENIPFPLDYFDFIFCFGVIEHVGDNYYFNKEWKALAKEREIFLKEVMAKLKNNGRLIITSPNRNFPIDFQHDAYGQSSLFSRYPIFFHSPFTKFLESYYSLKNKMRKYAEVIIDPMPLKGFFGFNIRKTLPPILPILRFMRIYLNFLDRLPKIIRQSCFNPYLAVNVTVKLKKKPKYEKIN